MVVIGDSFLTPGGMRQKYHAGGPPTLQGRSRVPDIGGDALAPPTAYTRRTNRTAASTRGVPIAGRSYNWRPDREGRRSVVEPNEQATTSPMATKACLCMNCSGLSRWPGEVRILRHHYRLRVDWSTCKEPFLWPVGTSLGIH